MKRQFFLIIFVLLLLAGFSFTRRAATTLQQVKQTMTAHELRDAPQQHSFSIFSGMLFRMLQ